LNTSISDIPASLEIKEESSKVQGGETILEDLQAIIIYICKRSKVKIKYFNVFKIFDEALDALDIRDISTFFKAYA